MPKPKLKPKRPNLTPRVRKAPRCKSVCPGCGAQCTDTSGRPHVCKYNHRPPCVDVPVPGGFDRPIEITIRIRPEPRPVPDVRVTKPTKP